MTKKNEERKQKYEQRLSEMENQVFSFLQWKLRGRNRMWFNSRQMAKRIPMSPIFLSKAISRLERKGLIVRDGRTRCIFFKEPQIKEDENHE